MLVHESNEDFENSYIRSLAKKYDPEFKRTITILSKIDLGYESKLKDIKSLLGGEKFKTSLGYYAMRGRNQEEKDAGTTIEDIINVESQFFSDRSEFDEVLERCGTMKVRERLQSILCDRIIENLQGVEENIFNTYQRYKKKFSLLSEPDS